MELSILTPTMRPGGLDVAVESLKRQTVWRELIERDAVEWLFVDELANDPQRQEAFRRACREIGLARGHHLYPADYDPPRFSKLNRANNTGLSVAQGQFLLIYQDYIVLADNAIERFLTFARQQRHPFLLSGICHRIGTPGASFVKAEGDCAYSIYREDFRYEMAEIGVREPMWVDGRVGSPAQSRIVCLWEANFALVPIHLVHQVKGWSENLDNGYGADNVELAIRILRQNVDACITIDHSVVNYGIEDRLYWDRSKIEEASKRTSELSRWREERFYQWERFRKVGK